MTIVPKTADVVIVGAGIAGLAVARALVQMRVGLRVVVVEMEPSYARGSTGKAAGSVRRQLHTETLTKIAIEGTKDILSYPEQYGVEVECERSGHLHLASSPAWRDKLLMEDAIHRQVGLSTEILAPGEIKKRWPFLHVGDLLVGTYSPEDVNVDPFAVATALYKGARSGGAQFVFGTRVEQVLRNRDGTVAGVTTTGGKIQAPVVVNAAGPWAAPLCVKAGLSYHPPMEPRRRQIWQIGSGCELPRHIPFIVDVDSPFYIKSYGEIFLLSLMEEEKLPLIDNDPPFDWSGMAQIEDRVTGRIPLLRNARIAKGWAGWRTLTPDDMPVVGKVDEVPGFWVSAGFGGHGISLAPFCGMLLASALLGEPSCDAMLSELRIDRFSPHCYR